MNGSKKKLYVGITAGVLLLCVIVGVVWKGKAQTAAVVENTPLVRTTVVGVAGASQSYNYSGEVRGRYESQLAFQVGGKIIRRNVELGSAVKQGEVLMQIDPKDIQQTVNSSLAQVYSTDSQLRLAESNLNRYRQLYEQNAVSRAQYDQYINAYDAAVAAARQASAQYAQGANQLDYSLLYADKPGVVASIAAEAGQVVSAGQAVVTVVQNGEREVEINVPENRVEEVRKAQQIKVSFWALPSVTIEGKVREIAPMADQVSRTYKVRVSLINPPQEMKLGMTATVTVSGGSSQKVADIPLAAIYQSSDSPAVWVVNGDVTNLRPIKTGQFGDGKIQVLEGLYQGDRIVTAGVHKLREGQKVRTAGDTL